MICTVFDHYHGFIYRRFSRLEIIISIVENMPRSREKYSRDRDQMEGEHSREKDRSRIMAASLISRSDACGVPTGMSDTRYLVRPWCRTGNEALERVPLSLVGTAQRSDRTIKTAATGRNL